MQIMPKAHVEIMYLRNAREYYGECGLSYATACSAGVDLRAVIEEEYLLEPEEQYYVPTGIVIAMPSYCMGGVYSRSGLGTKHGLVVTQGVGVIDSDYRGEIMVALTNRGKKAYTIAVGERIAQLVFHLILTPTFITVDSLQETERGTGAFGSTGKE